MASVSTRAVLATPLLPVSIKAVTKGQPGPSGATSADAGESVTIELLARDSPEELKGEQLATTVAIDFSKGVSHGDPVLQLALSDDEGFQLVVGAVPIDAALLPYLPTPEELTSYSLAASQELDKKAEPSSRAAGIAAVYKAFASRKMRPVFVDAVTYHYACAGFAQAVLWPVFHSRPYEADYVIAAHVAGTSQTASLMRPFTAAGTSGIDTLSGPFTRGPDGHANGTTGSLLSASPAQATLEETFLVAYRALNLDVARALAVYTEEGAAIVVHGHQSLLLPGFLRSMLKKGQTVALFNHLPFPTSELYRILPARYELLMRGMLGSDVVGFNSADYARHFLSSCVRIGGLETTSVGVHSEGRFVHTHVTPVGIDPRRIERLLSKPDVRARISDLRAQFSGKRVILGVDELDVTKGVTQKMMAFEELLKTRQEFRNNTVLIQVSTPPPPQASIVAESTEKLQWNLLEHVGKICGAFGQLTSPAGASLASGTTSSHSRFRKLSGGPIFYFTTQADEEELVCLYAIADLYLDTSLRDSLSIVPMEYVATRSLLSRLLQDEAKNKPAQSGSGTSSSSPAVPPTSSPLPLNAAVVVSEFTGLSQFLSGSFMLNPHDLSGMVEVIANALSSSSGAAPGSEGAATLDGQQGHHHGHRHHHHHGHHHIVDPLFGDRHQRMWSLVQRHTIQAWMGSLFKKVDRVKEDLEMRASLSSVTPLVLMTPVRRSKRDASGTPAIVNAATKAVVARFHASKHRVLLVDAEGVLMDTQPRFPDDDNDGGAGKEADAATILGLNTGAVAALCALATSSSAMNGPTTTVVIMSRKSRETMELLFDCPDKGNGSNGCPFVLVGENGAFVRWAPEAAWECELPGFAHPHPHRAIGGGQPAHQLMTPLHPPQPQWFAEVLPIFRYFSDRTPGSVLEIKEASITWHYGGALEGHTNKFALYQARDLASTLAEFTAFLPVIVVTSAVDKHVTVRMPHANKALIVYNLLRRLNGYRDFHSVGGADEGDDQELVIPRLHLRRDLKQFLAMTASQQRLQGQQRKRAGSLIPSGDGTASGVGSGAASTGPRPSSHVISVSQEYQSLPSSLWETHKSPDAASGAAAPSFSSSSSGKPAPASSKQSDKSLMVSTITGMLRRLFPTRRVDFVLALVSPSDPKDADVFGVLQRMHADVIEESAKQDGETQRGVGQQGSTISTGSAIQAPVGTPADPTAHLGALGTLGGSASPEVSPESANGGRDTGTSANGVITPAIPPTLPTPTPVAASTAAKAPKQQHHASSEEEEALARKREKKVLGFNLHTLLSLSLSPRPFRSPRAPKGGRFGGPGSNPPTSALAPAGAAKASTSILMGRLPSFSSTSIASDASSSSSSASSSTSSSASSTSLPSVSKASADEPTYTQSVSSTVSDAGPSGREQNGGPPRGHRHTHSETGEHETAAANMKGMSLPAPRPLRQYAASRKASNKSMGSLAGLAETMERAASAASNASGEAGSLGGNGSSDDGEALADEFPSRAGAANGSGKPAPVSRVMSSVALDAYELGIGSGPSRGISRNESVASTPASTAVAAGTPLEPDTTRVYRERGRSGSADGFGDHFTPTDEEEKPKTPLYQNGSAKNGGGASGKARQASVSSLMAEDGDAQGDEASNADDERVRSEAESRLAAPGGSAIVFVDCAVSRKDEMRRNARWCMENQDCAAAFLQILATSASAGAVM